MATNFGHYLALHLQPLHTKLPLVRIPMVTYHLNHLLRSLTQGQRSLIKAVYYKKITSRTLNIDSIKVVFKNG